MKIYIIYFYLILLLITLIKLKLFLIGKIIKILNINNSLIMTHFLEKESLKVFKYIIYNVKEIT